MKSVLRVIFAVGFLATVLSSPAQAGTYEVWGMDAHIDVHLIHADSTVDYLGGTGPWNPLQIVGDTITIDHDAPALLEFNITLTGDVNSMITLSQAVDVGLGAFDQIVVNSATFQNAVDATFVTTSVVGQLFWFDSIPANPLDPVIATSVSNLTLSNSGGGASLEVPYYPFDIAAIANGVINRSPAPGEITLGMAAVPIAIFQTTTGEILRVQATMTIFATHMPEPNTALLAMVSLLMVRIGIRARRAW